MRKNIINFLIGAVGVVAVVFVVKIVIDGQGSSAGGSGAVSSDNPVKVGDAAPDVISVSRPSGGDDQTVENKTAGYSFTMPSNWYLENNSAAETTIYPDYDPKSGDPATCKIEMSSFADALNSAGGLNDWITNHLHADPTADISDAARTNRNVGGDPGIEWQGSLNGVTTTLVYTSLANGEVLEFAPLTLSVPNDPDGDDCSLELEAVLTNLEFLNATNQ